MQVNCSSCLRSYQCHNVMFALGIVIGMPMSGILTSWISWKAAFYFYGVMGICWYACWLWLSFEKPRYHPAISIQELKYIEKSLGGRKFLRMIDECSNLKSFRIRQPSNANNRHNSLARNLPVIASLRYYCGKLLSLLELLSPRPLSKQISKKCVWIWNCGGECTILRFRMKRIYCKLMMWCFRRQEY